MCDKPFHTKLVNERELRGDRAFRTVLLNRMDKKDRAAVMVFKQ